MPLVSILDCIKFTFEMIEEMNFLTRSFKIPVENMENLQ